MYSFTGQNQFGNFNSTYASSPAAAAAYSAAVQSHPSVHTPTLGGIGGTNPTSVYAGFSSAAAAQTPSPYAPYGNPSAGAAAYAQFGQAAAAVASLQHHQQHQVQQQMQVANPSTGYGHNASRLTDSYNPMGPVSSAGGGYTQLSDYTTSLRTPVAAATIHQTSNNSFIGAPRMGSSSANQLTNSLSNATGTSSSAVYAAASSYLQSKAVGAGNVWMGSGKRMDVARFGGNNSYTGSPSSNIAITGSGRGGSMSRGRGSFPAKRFAQGRSTEVQQFYCEVCKISCAGAQTYREHIDGQKHKKKQTLQAGEGQTLSKSRVSFRCETCNVTCTGKDTYDSHVRGSKHQKTANLMRKLGKPVPDLPTVLAPGEKSNKPSISSNGTPIATVGGPAVPTKRVVGVPTVKFVGGEKLQTGAQEVAAQKVASAAEVALETSGKKNAAVEAALAAEKEVQPVGEDYVEEERNSAGKLLQYNCKLCDCKFSDPNAKNIHIKGRKHRLQYKLKVNPNLVVEVKPNQVPREIRSEIVRKLRSQRISSALPRPRGPPQPLLPSSRPWCGIMDPGRRIETSEDRHVITKHRQICFTESELAAIEKLVIMTEKGLKAVSDNLAEEKSGPEEVVKKEDVPPEGDRSNRVLQGVMRVEFLAKGLLLKSDKEVQLVLLCSQCPTRAMLSKICKLLPEHIEKNDLDIVTVIEKFDESALLLKHSNLDMICRITLTCSSLRKDVQAGSEEGDGATAGDKAVPSGDPLPKVPCLEALASLRHARWFQIKCTNLQSASVALSIFRDIRQRVSSWQTMNEWALELLVEKVLASNGTPLSPGDAVRRVFEAVAAGILFQCGPGLIDPCEKEVTDVLINLTSQQREDITSSSQHALRLIAFNQMYKVLGIDRLSDVRSSFGLSERKRPRDSNGSADNGEVLDVKKDKKDDAKSGEKKVA